MKIIFKILIILSFFLSILYMTNANADSWKVFVVTSEIIPWGKCQPIEVKKNWKTTVVPNRYKCEVGKWFWPIIEMIWKMIKYFTFIAWLGWVLFIVLNWIMYSMWWMDPSMKDEAKKRITATLLWLVLLLVSWVILKLVAPWVYS